jgi:alkylated DNA nucleotide flippase Atl1
MPRTRHYSPQLSRLVVSALYHEARSRKVPMTRLADSLLRQSLAGSTGWQQAQSLRVAEDSTTTPQQSSAITG